MSEKTFNYIILIKNHIGECKLFGNRLRSDGKYYTADFSLTELRLLKRFMREDYRSPMLNEKYEIITFQELIELVTILKKTNHAKFAYITITQRIAKPYYLLPHQHDKTS